MATLAEIRAKLAEQEKKTSNSSGLASDNAIFPFWNIAEGTTSTLRFLPDGDSNNTFFWQERAMIKLPFPGIKGAQDTKPTLVQIPCMEMFNEPCPILSEVRTWFKDPSLEDMGRKYWKKRSYIFQGFVVNSTLDEDTVPENPIRRFVINPSIFNIIRSALMNPDMEDLPTDNENGRDFKLTKTQKGGYADYSTSTWSFKARSLSETERSAIDKFGLHNLGDYMPKKPSSDEVAIMQELFKASVDGELYDPDRFAQYYKPTGFSGAGASSGSAQKSTASNVASTVASTVAPTPEPTVAPQPQQPAVAQPTVAVESAPATPEPVVAQTTQAAPATSNSGSADDILAMIRARQSNK
tara:strand:- start:11791 stop:12852 length:1062 start_codon:yes stop_codon:yes gene_type:complete